MFHENLLGYLAELSPLTLSRLYEEQLCALVVYRQLGDVAQYTIQRMLLTEGPTPFEDLRTWYATADYKSKQNPALLLLKNLQILQGRSGEVWINEKFRQSLINAFTSPNCGADPPSSSRPSRGEAGNTRPSARDRWEGILYGLVTGETEKDLQKLFCNARLAAAPRGAGGRPASTDITNVGFQFLLANRMTQLWTLIVESLRMLEKDFDVVPLIRATCRLALTQPGEIIMAGPREEPPHYYEWLHRLGLFEKESKNAWVATDLVGYLSIGAAARAGQTGYIILETNYKVYAYTESPLELAILGLFVKIGGRLATMAYGSLTGPSVQGALARGITADQIVAYLRLHAHPIMHQRRPAAQSSVIPAVIEDQIHLWERDKQRIRTVEGYLYQQFANESDFGKAVQEANRLNCALYVNQSRRLLVIKPEAHSLLKAFIKSEL